MATIQERIGNLGKMFAGLNIGADDKGQQYIYLEVTFPAGWGITAAAKNNYGVNVVKNEAGNGYYFWAPMENGFDAVFDAVECNIKANQEAQEKKNFLAEKIKELQQLVFDEDMSVLKTLEFKIKKKKAAAPKKKVGEVEENNETMVEDEK